MRWGRGEGKGEEEEEEDEEEEVGVKSRGEDECEPRGGTARWVGHGDGFEIDAVVMVEDEDEEGKE